VTALDPYAQLQAVTGRTERLALRALAIAIAVDILLSILVGILLVKVYSVSSTINTYASNTNAVVTALAGVDVCLADEQRTILKELKDAQHDPTYQFYVPPLCSPLTTKASNNGSSARS
jgi:hypothetical protein